MFFCTGIFVSLGTHPLRPMDIRGVSRIVGRKGWGTRVDRVIWGSGDRVIGVRSVMHTILVMRRRGRLHPATRNTGACRGPRRLRSTGFVSLMGIVRSVTHTGFVML